MRTLDTDATRIFEKLTVRPQYQSLPDEIKQEAVIEAIQQFLDYTNRTSYPGAAADSIVVDLAAAWLNNLGLEGFDMAVDGDMRRQASSMAAMSIRMDRWRLPLWTPKRTEDTE